MLLSCIRLKLLSPCASKRLKLIPLPNAAVSSGSRSMWLWYIFTLNSIACFTRPAQSIWFAWCSRIDTDFSNYGSRLSQTECNKRACIHRLLETFTNNELSSLTDKLPMSLYSLPSSKGPAVEREGGMNHLLANGAVLVSLWSP